MGVQRNGNDLMAGVMTALAGMANAAVVGSGVHVSPTPAWGSIYGFGVPSTVSQTIAGITAPISVSASLTGTAILYYTLNSSFGLYSGAFTVHASDTLIWSVEAPGSTRVAGTITVTNLSDGSATLGTIPYSVKSDSGH